MIGYDHKVSGNGRRHWFGNHPDNVMSPYEEWVRQNWCTVPKSLEGHSCEIINCTPGSAITAFPKMDLEKALEL